MSTSIKTLARNLNWLINALLFSACFLTLRLTNLTILPPYVDEGYHLTRAFNVLREGTPFVYTEGGKYLQIWLITPVVGLGDDPFWNARAVSVGLGLLSAWGCYLLGLTIFKRESVAWLAAWGYLLIPYAFFLDRLALNDSLLGTLTIYLTWVSLKLMEQDRPKLGWLIGLGLLLGLLGLTKLNGLILWSIPLLTMIFIRPDRFLTPVRSIVFPYTIGLLMIAPLTLAPDAHLDGPATKTWLLDAPLTTPFLSLWWENTLLIWGYWQTYLTWPILLTVLAGIGLTVYHLIIATQKAPSVEPAETDFDKLSQRESFHRESLLLLSIVGLYNVAFIIISVHLPARYVFAVVPLLLPIGGYALVTLANTLRRRIASHLILTLLLSTLYLLLALPAMQFNRHLLSDPTQAQLDPYARWSFIDGWTSGYGLFELTDFLRSEAETHGEIAVLRNDTSGLTREGLDLTLADAGDSIDLVTLDLRVESPNRLTRLLQESERPVYVVLRLPLAPGALPYTINFEQTPFCDLATRFDKPDGFNYVAVYRCEG